MASHYSSLGFAFQSQEHFEEVTADLAGDAEEIPLSDGDRRYLRYTTSSGAELWLQVNDDNELIGAHPHYAGDTEVLITATAVVKREDATELDAAIHAWAGEYPFLFDCANFHQFADVELPAAGSVQIAAFAHHLKYFQSEEAYDASLTREPKLASRSFIPSGLFGEEGSEPKSMAVFTGHVLDAARKVNDVFDQEFLWAAVETLGGTFDVVADPELLDVVPAPGGILTGAFWLSGCLRELYGRQSPPNR
jgi:hypothetical protein